MSSAISSPITSQPPQVEFTNRFVQPPSGLYVFRDDKLFVRSQSRFVSQQLILRARLLTPAGNIATLEYKHETNIASREPTLTTHNISEGFLIGLALVPETATFARGDAYATVGITRGGDEPGSITQVLASDYIEALSGPTFPTGPVLSTVSGRGALNDELQTDPAAGDEFSITIPNRARQRLVSAFFTLVTDGTAADRRFTLELATVGGVMVQTLATASQPASTTRSYSLAHWGESPGLIASTEMINWPDHAFMSGGNFLRTNTANLQAGDNYVAPLLFIEEWLEE